MRNHKLLAMLTAILLLPVSGCGLMKETGQGATLDVDLSKSYAIEKITMKGSQLTPIKAVQDGCIMSRYSRRDGELLYLYNSKTGDFAQMGDWHDKMPDGVGQRDDGSYVVIHDDPTGRQGAVNTYDHKSRTVEIYSPDLTLTESFPMPEDVPVGYQFIMGGDGNWLLISLDDDAFYGYYALDADFNVLGEIECDDYTSGVNVGASGDLYAYLQNGDYAHEIKRIDLKNRTFEPMTELQSEGVEFVMDGSGDYELYYSVDDGIYGMHADGTTERILDFGNSDLPDEVWQCYALQDGSFIVDYREDFSNEFNYYLMKPRTEEEIAHIQVISLAGVNISHRLVQEIAKYNQSQNVFRFVIKDYGKEMLETTTDPNVKQELVNARNEFRDPSVDYTPAVESFKNDLLSGVVPDVVVMDNLPYRLLSNKGILVDLAPKLKEDSRFDESLYHMNYLDGLKNGERLDRIGFSFKLESMVGRTDLVGDKQGLNVDEYLAMLQSCPEGTSIFSPNFDFREMYLGWFVDGAQNAFIDKGNMTCSFDSPTFVKLLEYVGTIPSYDEAKNAPVSISYGDGGYNGFAEGDYLLSAEDFVKPITYHQVHYGTFRREDITLVGYPETGSGNGGMYRMSYTLSLTSRSKMGEPVWDFIMDELGKQKQSKMCMDSWEWDANAFPIMKEPLENAILAATRGANRDLGNMNDQEAAVFREYFENVRMLDDPDSFVSQIIWEEADQFFDGDITAQQAADHIQSRVGIYLSEMK